MIGLSFVKPIAIIVFLTHIGICRAQHEPTFPTPPVNPNQLFYLQRTPNTNTVIYELNFTKTGELNADEPVHAFWIRYADKGQRAELSYIQRKFAYGIRSKMLSKDSYELRIVAHKASVLYLHRTGPNKFSVYTTINNKLMVIKKIFLKINGGSVWSPNVEYVEFKGTDPGSGVELTERFKIAS